MVKRPVRRGWGFAPAAPRLPIGRLHVEQGFWICELCGEDIRGLGAEAGTTLDPSLSTPQRWQNVGGR